MKFLFREIELLFCLSIFPLKKWEKKKVTSIFVPRIAERIIVSFLFIYCHFNVIQTLLQQHLRFHRELHAFAIKRPLLKYLNFTS